MVERDGVEGVHLLYECSLLEDSLFSNHSQHSASDDYTHLKIPQCLYYQYCLPV